MLAKPPDHYRTDPEPDRVRTLLFATIPFDYYADRAEYFAGLGVEGAMLAGIMSNWSDDVWALGDGTWIVGGSNPRFQTCKRMNARCREVGITQNSVKVAFYKLLPDWFDDGGWRTLCENFRQCAIFARDAGFAGVAIDIEYIAQMYVLDYEAYQAPDYPRGRLRAQARRRGRELMEAMIGEFPEMVNWHLPEGIYHYGPLAADLFVGMVDALAERDAPGGIHVCTEATYTRTDPVWVVRFCHWLDGALADACDGKAREYWRRRGTICPGLWPLGYYRDILGPDGKRIGYSGRRETFGDRVVGSYADKSENYPPEDFRRQYAAARMVARHSLWVYCHGSVLWQLTEEEKARYGGSASDVLPVAKNLDEYLAVMRGKPIFDSPAFAKVTAAVREGREIDMLAGTGTPRQWWHIGPFPNPEGKGLDTVYPPEQTIDLDASYESLSGPLRWQLHALRGDGFVNLRHLVARKDYVLAYSVTWVESPSPQKAFIRFGSDDSGKIWVNGKLVHSIDVVRGATEDEDIVPVELPAGRIPILVKCGNYRGTWGFYLRITDSAGDEISNLHWAGSETSSRR